MLEPGSGIGSVRDSSAVESGFKCVEHVDAKLVLRDNLALMDQELINRILFG